MKRKLLVCGVLVVVCLGVFGMQGVSQSQLTGVSTPPPPPTPPSTPKANFATVQPQQDWSFEQLVEALKGVRARQKELKTQEADLLAKMADKIEQKRKDLQKAEEVLHELQGERNREKPAAEEKNPVTRY